VRGRGVKANRRSLYPERRIQAANSRLTDGVFCDEESGMLVAVDHAATRLPRTHSVRNEGGNMRRVFFSFVAIAAIGAVCATAQAQYGAPPNAQQPGYAAPAPYAAPQPAPPPQPTYGTAVAPAPAEGPVRTVSGFLGPRLSLDVMAIEGTYGTITMFTPSLEGGLCIKNIVELYLGFGTVVYGLGRKAEDGDNDTTDRYGNLMLQLGARIHLTKPRPGTAFLYTGLDLTWIIGIAKVDTGGDNGEADSDAEDAAKEAIDRFGIGLELGVELLVTENFGIGAESGLRVFINNLKDTLTGAEADAVDKYREAYLEVPFMLRFMYHF
jgi:hypothetical protein